MKKDFYKKYFGFINSIIEKTVCDPYNPERRDDYLQECYLALLEAKEKYDDKKSSFSNYAYIVVRGRLLDYIRKQTSLSREDYKIVNTIQNLISEKGIVRYEDISKNFNVSKERFYRLLSLSKNSNYKDLLYFNYDYYSNDDFEVVVEDKKELKMQLYIKPTQVHRIDNNKFRKKLDIYLDRLTAKERTVIKLKYYHDKSISEIASIFNVSVAAVSHMHKKAIKKLKSYIGDNVNEYLHD